MIMVTALKMFRWLSISFGQGCFSQEPVLISEIASSLASRRANRVSPWEPRERALEDGLRENFLADAGALAG